MFKKNFLLALSTVLLFGIFQFAAFSQSQSNAAMLASSGTMPQFFTVPARDESGAEHYLMEGVELEWILRFAWSKAETGYYKGAEFLYQLASQRFPNNFNAQSSLATFYYQMGRANDAVRQFEVARNIAVNPQNRDSARYFVERINREAEVGKEATDAYYTGINAFFSDDFVNATQALEQSLIASPNWIHAQYWLGRSYYEQGQVDKARMNLEAVIDFLPATDERAMGATWLLQLLDQ